MLGQAAAVLISLSTLITLEITTIALLPILDKMLTLAGASGTSLAEIFGVLILHIIVLIAFDGILISLGLQLELVVRQAWRWRR